jgi:rhodanese-related sulfurtransferase
MPREISPPALAELLREGRPVLLVDVREAWEREIARLPGDVHVPLESLPARLGEIVPPEGGEVVIYCHAGVRSWHAAAFLEQALGLREVASLGGGIDAWSWLVDPSTPRY